jgi:selenocysteine lyase/cysteine desulfurase
MLKAALEQILRWKAENIQHYCFELLRPLRNYLEDKKLEKDDDEMVSTHLYGLFLPKNIDLSKLMDDLKTHHIHLSARGNSIRISPNVYNDSDDIQALIEVLDRHL